MKVIRKMSPEEFLNAMHIKPEQVNLTDSLIPSMHECTCSQCNISFLSEEKDDDHCGACEENSF